MLGGQEAIGLGAPTALMDKKSSLMSLKKLASRSTVDHFVEEATRVVAQAQLAGGASTLVELMNMLESLAKIQVVPLF